MNFVKYFLAMAAIWLLPLQAFAEMSGYARLNLLEGDVQIRMDGTTEWVPAAINTPLEEGDSIWCPDGSRAEIQLQNGTFVRLDEQSSLDILALDADFQQYYLGMGHLYVRTGQVRGKGLQVDVNDTAVKVYERSRFRIDVDQQGNEDISIIKGAAYVESSGRETRVRTGEMFSMEDSGPEILPLEPPDNWEYWNQERDRLFFGRKAKSTYLPDELNTYAADLDNNGEWIEVRDYGYVWRPTVIDFDWSPYRVGRWVWRGGDYVWISQENWGWAPYHYGRWVVVPTRGWCWVPPQRGDVYWAPGYVGWVSTPTHVGWVPLAPGETYYGRGYYGRHSVNITRVDMRATTTITYRNITVNNAVTVVNRDGFARGRGTYDQARRDNIGQARPVMGRPDIRPVGREALMPRVKQIPSYRQPPPKAESVTVRELRVRHPRLDEKKTTTPAVRQPQPQTPQQGMGRPQQTPDRKAPRQEGVRSKDSGIISTTVPPGKPAVGDQPPRKADQRGMGEERRQGQPGDMKSPDRNGKRATDQPGPPAAKKDDDGKGKKVWKIRERQPAPVDPKAPVIKQERPGGTAPAPREKEPRQEPKPKKERKD